VVAGVACGVGSDAPIEDDTRIEIEGGANVTRDGTKAAARAEHRRYAVLDALRFMLALWVTIGHYEAFPLFAGVNEATPVGRFLVHAWQSIVFGTPAVIVFFVISGFCIHLPFRGDAKLNVGKYYVRRYTRILIPVAGAVCVYRLVGQRFVFWGEHSILWQSPLWSLLCEEIYYAVYPLLRRLGRAVSWRRVIPAAFVVSVAVAATHVHALSWHDFGPLGTAAILLPVWLLGCLLAEEAESLPEFGDGARWRIWMWRFGVWFASWITEMLHFKAHVPLTQTMAWFGVIAYFWVKNELAWSKRHAPWRALAWAGLWSYSLYLVHAQSEGMWYWLRIPLGPRLNWCGMILSSLVGAYVFYLVVERPSHRLARWIGSMRSTSSTRKAVVESPVDRSGTTAEPGAVSATTI
jgi:peptidoglycan/LPS O-acetylase OafA/YrhL